MTTDLNDIKAGQSMDVLMKVFRSIHISIPILGISFDFDLNLPPIIDPSSKGRDVYGPFYSTAV
jgi:hypothetical protein